mgnify:CR=1 FL=1
MARTEIEHIVVPSLLDRLTDEAPKVSVDPQISRADSVRNFRRSVERDVETLLNSRRTMYPAAQNFPELRQSVYDYGLIDTTGIPVGTKAGRERLLAGNVITGPALIEEAASVTLVPPGDRVEVNELGHLAMEVGVA